MEPDIRASRIAYQRKAVRGVRERILHALGDVVPEGRIWVVVVHDRPHARLGTSPDHRIDAVTVQHLAVRPQGKAPQSRPGAVSKQRGGGEVPLGWGRGEILVDNAPGLDQEMRDRRRIDELNELDATAELQAGQGDRIDAAIALDAFEANVGIAQIY